MASLSEKLRRTSAKRKKTGAGKKCSKDKENFFPASNSFQTE